MATGASTASKSLTVIDSWGVEKYARFVTEPLTNSLISQKSKAGSWKVNSVNYQRRKNLQKYFTAVCK